MTDESQNLVQDVQESSIIVDNTAPRRNALSCNRGSLVTALSVFVALLIAGQAVTVYYVFQHQEKITKIDHTTKELKMENMLKKLPGSRELIRTPSKPKMSMASIDIPLMVRDPNQPIPLSREELRNIAVNSNEVGDAVHYVLRSRRPFRTFQTFNDTTLENLKELKKTLSDEEWMLFDSWLQQWFLLYLVQNPKTTKEAALIKKSIPTEVPVMTQCQLQASAKAQPGIFRPKCEDNGDFELTQCWHSTGYCWCVYKNGTEVPETKTRGTLTCNE
uniref:Thyroglobulin type-1 domain-containing protein n=1 Tax=Leptobrachium leishanense TaxID=445787 RepID=A0A8C5MBE2_9ANUR